MKNKSQILLVIRWPLGGIRTFIRYVYNEFDSQKYHLTIIAPDIPELKVLIQDLSSFEITTISFDNNASLIKAFYLISKTIILKKFHVIHSHGFTAGALSSLSAKLTHTAHLLTPHEVFVKDQLKGLKGSCIKLVLSILLRMIDVIHCVSNDALDNLYETLPVLRKRHDNCVVIPNGIDVKRFKRLERIDFHKSLNLSHDTFFIGYFGRFMPAKGFIFLIEAIEILARTKNNLPKKPAVLSFGLGGFIREEKVRIEKKGLTNMFYFLPYEPNIAQTLKGLDVVAIPSLWETCPLLPMEAMVAGVPVIGTNCIGLREVLRDTPSTIVSSKDSKALANAIEKEMFNPSKIKAEAFSLKASQRYSVRETARELNKMIIHLMD